MVFLAMLEANQEAKGLLGPDWRDVVEVVVAIFTAAATVVGWLALWRTKREAERNAQARADERQRAHDRDILKSVLGFALREYVKSSGEHFWAVPYAYMRTLSDDSKARLDVTPLFFNFDQSALKNRLRSKGYTSVPSGRLLGTEEWDPPVGGPGEARFGRSILAAVFDELIRAIDEVVK